MAGRSARGRRTSQESTFLMRTPERTRRSLSTGDDTGETPRPGAGVQMHGANPSPTRDGFFHSSTSAEHGHAAKRLGFLGDMLLSTTAGAAQLLPPRGHSRAESANPLSRDMAPSPSPTLAAVTAHHAKGHASPSKLVSREMHRLGTLAHLPVLNSSISASSNASLAPPSTTSLGGSTSNGGDNPWAAFHIHILPLFNGEGLRMPIEDMNGLAKRHIHTVVSSSPSKAMATLEHDASELIASGMVTLSSRLELLDEEALVDQVVKIWEFFWDEVLPYVEGALLPLQTDSLLSSLYRIPKVHKPASPAGPDVASALSQSPKIQQLDVRSISLRLFRDQIVYPIFPVLHDRLNTLKERYPQTSGYPPRLQQMLLVLLSQRSLPVLYSLTAPPLPPPPGEEAVQLLLRAIRTPLVQISPDNRHYFGATGAPSFLSAGLPRDRRGRIARKPEAGGGGAARTGAGAEEDARGEDTPRVGVVFGEPVREREMQLLASLRSPDPESARASMGGWGLGLGGEEKAREDDEDETLDWDQAQAVVERMVGMKPVI